MTDAREMENGTLSIAVVGVAAMFPGSTDSEGFWRDIVVGKDLITDVPATHWLPEDYFDADPAAIDKTYARRGAFLEPVDFDTLKFGLPPTNLKATDTSQLLSLIVAQRVFDDATGDAVADIDLERVSVIIGVTSAQELYGQMVSRMQRPVWVKAMRESGLHEDDVQSISDRISEHYVPWQESTFPGLLGNVVAGRIANRLDLGGTNCVTDAACASSFSAVSMAVNELRIGQSDMVIVGGADTMNDILMYMCFAKTPALSESGDCRPFSAAADGTMLGEGIGMVALRRLEDAERDGNKIYAVLRGVGTSSDGRATSVYAPVPEGQAKALRRAYEAAGYTPDTVELVEAHGTGTRAGDAAEAKALTMVFGEASDRLQYCALGSVKSQMGHAKAASGAAGLFKAVMALHHRVLPPTIKVDKPNPDLGLKDSAFYLNSETRPWIGNPLHPRRAGVSSFGFGGSNFHLALEEYSGQRAPRLRSFDYELSVFCADSRKDLLEDIRALATSEVPGLLQRTSFERTSKFEAAAEHRLAIVAADDEELKSKLLKAAQMIEASPEAFSLANGIDYGIGADDGEIAFLFPGQGSQYLNMGRGLALHFDTAVEVWDSAAELNFGVSERLHDVVFPVPVFDDEARKLLLERLTKTEWAQPGIGCVSLSMLALLKKMGLEASSVGGHSFGDVTALHVSGVLSAEDLLLVARKRGEVMASAAQTPGSMIAISRPIEEVRQLIERLELDLVVANHNAPNQVVLSGATDAIVEAQAKLKAEGIRPTRLRVATAFHSSIVSDSVGPFFEFLSDVDFGQPLIRAYANATASPYPKEAPEARRCLADQIASPVRFVEQIEAMHASGARTFIEVGPSSVLTSLVSQILDGQPHRAISLDRKNETGLRSFLIGIGKMAAAGIDLDLGILWQGYGEPAAETDHVRSPSSVSLRGPNYGNLYPPEGGIDALPKPNLDAPEIGERRTLEPSIRGQAPSSGSEAMWLNAFEESQRQTAVAHSAFQKAMTDAHSAFLKSSEASLRSLAAAFGGNGAELDLTAPGVEYAMPEMPDLSVFEVAKVPDVVDVVGVEKSGIESPVPQQAPESGPTIDVAALLMHIVAEKTGYPIEMLNLGMDLEADLGIDSIKRVEILSAMAEKVPELPEIDASQMVGLRTLAEIVDAMSADLGPGEVSAGEPAVDVTGILLDVVAEKTGYPVEMLNLSMDLEADLGIDSIKRVEILSAMIERAPGLPEVDASEMVGLRTLAQIVASMSENLPSEATPVMPEAPVAPEVDVAALLVEVVAEKTGYPVEMLNLGMDLEGDLGIDSIKRVEILSAMVERVPELPEVEASEMVNLRTLNDVVVYMDRGRDQSRAVAEHAEKTTNSSINPSGLSGLSGPSGLGRFALEVVDAPALGMAQSGLLQGGLIAVTDDGFGVGAALVEILSKHGVTASVVTEVPENADGIVFLGGLRRLSMVEEAIEINREAFRITRSFAPNAKLLVTVQDTGGCFAVDGVEPERAYLGGLSALAKTASQEWPGASVKAIDLECAGRTPSEIAQVLANELISGGPELEVGLSGDGRRTTLRSVRRAVTIGEPTVNASSVLVVSGGARGVTAATMIALAREARPHFLLLGRTKLEDEPVSCDGVDNDADLRRSLLADAGNQGLSLTPAALDKRLRQVVANREIRSNLRALESAGAEVCYLSVDVTDTAAVDAAIGEVRELWGPITGLIHGAGLIKDRLIAEKSDEDFDRVFDTKVEGLRSLLSATADDPLRFICLFSSIAARTGNPGQSDYAMANEVLNKVASAQRQARGGECLVKSLGWGPWDGGMVTKDIGARFEARGVPLLPIKIGEKMLVDELCGSSPDEVEIVLGAKPWAVPGDGSHGDFSMDLVVNRQSHPYLGAHAINGTPVMPVVLAVEWFARVARALRPDLQMACLHDLKVLKGVRLEGFNDGGDRFVLRGSSEATENGVSLEMTVEASDGTKHYSATVELVARRGRPTLEFPSLDLPEWENQQVYGGVLFHGPEFQVIREVNGISDEGISATLKGIRESRWSAETWRTDAASFDGGLQLALLWSERVLGGASLPTRIDEVRTWTDDLPDGPVLCVLKGREASNGRTLSDVSFQSENGQLIAELVGVETHALPSGF